MQFYCLLFLVSIYKALCLRFNTVAISHHNRLKFGIAVATLTSKFSQKIVNSKLLICKDFFFFEFPHFEACQLKCQIIWHPYGPLDQWDCKTRAASKCTSCSDTSEVLEQPKNKKRKKQIVKVIVGKGKIAESVFFYKNPSFCHFGKVPKFQFPSCKHGTAAEAWFSASFRVSKVWASKIQPE